MPGHLTHRPRRYRLALAVLSAALVALALAPATGDAGTVPLSIAVQGNQFVNGAGQTVRLLGVDHASFEYACEEGYAYDDGNMTADDAAAIASWKATAVRVPLNEDCWLGINGMPSNSQNPVPALTMAGYRQAVEAYVSDLTNAGLYVILDLHWTAPGTFVADGQRAMPDDHSAAFWTSVASTFASNPAVVFDAFNEPYSPAMVNDPARPVSWDCWESGGCAVPDANDSSQTPNDAQIYDAVGMQAMVDAIRATGARQPILLGGLSYANDLSGWLSHEPTDPLGQLAASFHNYQGEACATQACWDSQVAPVAAKVPVVTGEFDQDVCSPSTFDADYMSWADQHGIGYLAWGWWVLSAQEISDDGCSAYYLITDPSGTPAAPNGVNLHDHLATLPAVGSAPTTTTPTSTPTTPSTSPAPTANAPKLSSLAAKVASNGRSVSLTVKANESGSARISATTTALFAVGPKHHRQHVTLGSTHVKLLAGRSKTVAIPFSSTLRALIARVHRVKMQVTITLTNAARTHSVSRRTITLQTI
jgi:endoglucanase